MRMFSILAIVVSLLSACTAKPGALSDNSSLVPDARVVMLQSSAGRLYVADENYSDIMVYGPPFSAASKALFSRGTPTGAQTVAADSKYVAASSYGIPYVDVYAQPLTRTSAVVARIPVPDGIGEQGEMAFDHTGNLWLGAGFSNRILEYKPPFSNASMPIHSISYFLEAAAFDGADRLYAIAPTKLTMFAPPYIGSGITIKVPGAMYLLGLAAFANELVVTVVTQTSYELVFYRAPLTTASKPNFIVPFFSDRIPTDPAFDAAGNLWVPWFPDTNPVPGGGGVLFYRAPLTRSSRPEFDITTGINNAEQVVVSP
ncbi:MAG: hypothetical protein JO322_02780 [Candidatus Eremiobacteraeota bacterium]|nr:hypothetical protein [Candidatus Eremiobacteraeota bacterium]